jgi:hypothetical protein
LTQNNDQRQTTSWPDQESDLGRKDHKPQHWCICRLDHSWRQSTAEQQSTTSTHQAPPHCNTATHHKHTTSARIIIFTKQRRNLRPMLLQHISHPFAASEPGNANQQINPDTRMQSTKLHQQPAGGTHVQPTLYSFSGNTTTDRGQHIKKHNMLLYSSHTKLSRCQSIIINTQCSIKCYSCASQKSPKSSSATIVFPADAALLWPALVVVSSSPLEVTVPPVEPAAI